DPRAITLAFAGADRVEVDASGDLVVRTAGGQIREHKPFLYQYINGIRHEVTGSYVLDDSRHVGIRIGTFDPSHALVIDPVLDYSSYLGGSNIERAPLFDPLLSGVSSIAVAPAGNAYVTGSTASPDFPTTPGVHQTLGGVRDAFVTKLSPSSALLYSMYLGGP